jgi:hypothetical protein
MWQIVTQQHQHSIQMAKGKALAEASKEMLAAAAFVEPNKTQD